MPAMSTAQWSIVDDIFCKYPALYMELPAQYRKAYENYKKTGLFRFYYRLGNRVTGQFTSGTFAVADTDNFEESIDTKVKEWASANGWPITHVYVSHTHQEI